MISNALIALSGGLISRSIRATRISPPAWASWLSAWPRSSSARPFRPAGRGHRFVSAIVGSIIYRYIIALATRYSPCRPICSSWSRRSSSRWRWPSRRLNTTPPAQSRRGEAGRMLDVKNARKVFERGNRHRARGAQRPHPAHGRRRVRHCRRLQRRRQEHALQRHLRAPSGWIPAASPWVAGTSPSCPSTRGHAQSGACSRTP